jgi:hypothetical protein
MNITGPNRPFMCVLPPVGISLKNAYEGRSGKWNRLNKLQIATITSNISYQNDKVIVTY